MDEVRELVREQQRSRYQRFRNSIISVMETQLGRMQYPNPRGVVPETTFHDYQIQAVLATRNHFRDNGNGMKALIVAPPGSGKTGMVTALPYVLGSKKCLIVTPAKIITEQIAIAFGSQGVEKSFFFKVGFLDHNTDLIREVLETPYVPRTPAEIKNSVDHNLAIINAQKFGGRAGTSLSPQNPAFMQAQTYLRKFDTVIVDEAHHFPAQTWENIIDCFQDKKVVFLTATPFRGNIRNETQLTNIPGLRTVYEVESDRLLGVTIREMNFEEKDMDNGLPEFGEEFMRIVRRDIDFELREQIRQEPRFQAMGIQPQALILVNTVEDCRLVAARLGEDATFIVSETKEKNRKDFDEGLKRIGVICKMLLEGYDNAKVTLCVILRRCQARQTFEQFIGRCARIHRDLTGTRATSDRTTAKAFSYTRYGQQLMWDAREQLADPDEMLESDDDE